jgi:hypothetical protein
MRRRWELLSKGWMAIYYVLKLNESILKEPSFTENKRGMTEKNNWLANSAT